MADLFLARYKRKLHFLIWVLDRDEAAAARRPQALSLSRKEDRDLVNGFLSAKDPRALLSAAKAFERPMLMDVPVLDVAGVNAPQKIVRSFSVDEFAARRGDFSAGSRMTLDEECRFYVPLQSSDGSKESSARKAVADFGGVDGERFDRAVDRVGDEGTIIVEPLADWLFLRNCLTLAGFLSASLSSSECGEDLLETAGFLRGDFNPKQVLRRKSIGIYHLPICYDVGWRDVKTSEVLLSGVKGLLPWVKDGYFSWIQYGMRGMRRRVEHESSWWELDGGRYCSDPVRLMLLSAPQATGSMIKLTARQEYEDRRAYLAVEADAPNQREIAERLIRTLYSAIIENGCFDLEFGKSGAPSALSLAPTSLESALWLALLGEHGNRIHSCSVCGTVFVASDNTKKGTCSGYCRTKAGRLPS